MNTKFTFLGFNINAATVIAFLLYLTPLIESQLHISVEAWQNLVQIVIANVFLIIGKLGSAKFTINSSTLGAVLIGTLTAALNQAGINFTGDSTLTPTMIQSVTEIIQAIVGVFGVYGIHNSYIKADLLTRTK